MDAIQQNKKSIDIRPGLFLLRYESAEDPTDPPRVLIRAENGGADGVQFILPPDADQPVLWSPGACCVVRADRNGRIEIGVTAMRPDGSVGAKVQLVPLSIDPDGIGSATDLPLAEVDLSRVQVLGHVAGVGDIRVPLGEWIAGPAAPSRVEGLSIEWPDKPAHMVLRYAARVGGPKPATSPLRSAGEFAGTRGRALPLVGATLQITGAGARLYHLVVDALFLGSPQMRVAGRRVVIAGPTGREPLVGLRIQLEPASQLEASAPISTKPAQRESSQRGKSQGVQARQDQAEKPDTVSKPKMPLVPEKRSNKVRVFRGGVRAR